MENEKDDRWLEAASIRDWLDKRITLLEVQKGVLPSKYQTKIQK